MLNSSLLRRSVLVLLLAVFAFGLSSVGAADNAPGELQRAPAQETLFSGLIAQAEQSGSVRVIVGFNAAFTPEGNLSPAAAQQQQVDIAQTRANLVSSMAAYNN